MVVLSRDDGWHSFFWMTISVVGGSFSTGLGLMAWEDHISESLGYIGILSMGDIMDIIPRFSLKSSCRTSGSTNELALSET